MPPAITLGHIIGPVATATVLNVFAFSWLSNPRDLPNFVALICTAREAGAAA